MKKIKETVKQIRQKKHMLSYVILFASFVLAVYICFYKLGSALENWDEAWYADVVRHMIRSREYFVMYWNREIFLDKPPLYMWLTVPFVKILGMKEIAFRLVSAVSGFLTIVLIVISAYRMYGLVPALVAFSTLAFNNIYIWRVRSGNLDSLLTFLFVLAYFFMIKKTRYRYPILGIIFGLIYLEKLTIVFLPLAVFIILELIYENRRVILRIPYYLILALLMVALGGFWLHIGTQKAGGQFSDYFLNRADQGVSNVSIANFKTDYIRYMYYSLQRRFFWLVLIGGAIALFKLRDKKYLAQILFAFALVAQLSFTTRTNNWYILPSVPFWSLLAALATYYIFNLFRNNIAVVLLFCLFAGYFSYKTFVVNVQSIIYTSGPENLKQSSLIINKRSNYNDIVVRLDQLYPSSIFYTDRKVLSSPDWVSTGGLFISRDDVAKEAQSKQIKWIFGTNDEVEQFLKGRDTKLYKKIQANNEETILQVL